jgi:hypothetical protein
MTSLTNRKVRVWGTRGLVTGPHRLGPHNASSSDWQGVAVGQRRRRAIKRIVQCRPGAAVAEGEGEAALVETAGVAPVPATAASQGKSGQCWLRRAWVPGKSIALRVRGHRPGPCRAPGKTGCQRSSPPSAAVSTIGPPSRASRKLACRWPAGVEGARVARGEDDQRGVRPEERGGKGPLHGLRGIVAEAPSRSGPPVYWPDCAVQSSPRHRRNHPLGNTSLPPRTHSVEPATRSRRPAR